jgi:hypothetical protein
MSQREVERLCRCKAEVHQGADYTVVMLGAQSTEEASIHIFGDTRAESLAVAERIAAMWNAARVPSAPKKG